MWPITFRSAIRRPNRPASSPVEVPLTARPLVMDPRTSDWPSRRQTRALLKQDPANQWVALEVAAAMEVTEVMEVAKEAETAMAAMVAPEV